MKTYIVSQRKEDGSKDIVHVGNDRDKALKFVPKEEGQVTIVMEVWTHDMMFMRAVKEPGGKWTTEYDRVAEASAELEEVKKTLKEKEDAHNQLLVLWETE